MLGPVESLKSVCIFAALEELASGSSHWFNYSALFMSGLETSEDIVIIYIFSIVASSLPSVVKNPIYQYSFGGEGGGV